MRSRRAVAIYWAAIGGLCLWLASYPHMWWIAVAGTAALFRALDTHHRIAASFTFATFLFAPLVWWVSVLGIEAWALLLSMCVLPFLLLAAVRIPQGRLGPAVFAAGYPLVEQVHASFPWGGFPWGLIAFTQLDGPFAWLSRLGGQSLVAFGVCFVGASLTTVRVQPRAAMTSVLAALLVTGGAVAFTTRDAGELTVAAIQGGVPRPELPPLEQIAKVLDNHIQQTMRTNLAGIDLVVWPESAAMDDPLHNPSTTTQVSALVSTIDIPTVVGATVLDPGATGPSNAALLWLPQQGPTARYDKRHLVPFGEYIPNRSVVGGIVAPFTDVAVDFLPGRTLGLFSVANQEIGTLICFEVAYDSQIREAIRAGATGLLALSNNSTYLGTAQPWQQFAITRFRAFEHARPIVVATTSGVSGVIDSDGGVVAQAGEVGSASALGTIHTQAGLMPVDRFGPWALWLCAIGYLASNRWRRVPRVTSPV